MALNSGFTTLDASNNTFSDWLIKTNDMIDLMRDDVVTANSSGAETTGDAKLFGVFVSNTVVVADEIRGGDYVSSANLVVTSNLNVDSAISAASFDSVFPSTDGASMGNSTFQWEGYFSDIVISGSITAPSINTDIVGTLEGNLTGDIYNTDGVIRLDSGTNSIPAYFVGDIRAKNGSTVILNSGTNGTDASYTGSIFSTNVNIDGGTIDGTTVGASSPRSGSFTTLAANTISATDGISGDLTGDVVGDVTGDLTGDVVANSVVVENLTANNVIGNLDVSGNVIIQNDIQVNDIQSNNISSSAITGDLTGDVIANTVNVVTLSSPTANLYINSATSSVEILGNGSDTEGKIVLNCETNAHGQTIKPQPHSASVTNVLTLPAGNDQEIVGTIATQTLTNKTLTSPTITSADISSSSIDSANISSSDITSSTITSPTIIGTGSITGELTAVGTAPSSASDTGTAGDIRYDSDYIYICVATDTWKRVLIETWS